MGLNLIEEIKTSQRMSSKAGFFREAVSYSDNLWATSNPQFYIMPCRVIAARKSMWQKYSDINKSC